MERKETNEGMHADPEYIKKAEANIMSMPTVNITEWKPGTCSLCKEKIENHPDAYFHLGCANAYEDKRKENLKIFMSQQKGVKAR